MNATLADRLVHDAACPICTSILSDRGPHPRITHTPETGNSWRRSSKTGECTRCGRLFASVSAFDAHRGSEGCEDPRTVRTRRGTPRFAPAPQVNAHGSEVWHLAGARPSVVAA